MLVVSVEEEAMELKPVGLAPHPTARSRDLFHIAVQIGFLFQEDALDELPCQAKKHRVFLWPPGRRGLWNADSGRRCVPRLQERPGSRCYPGTGLAHPDQISEEVEEMEIDTDEERRARCSLRLSWIRDWTSMSER
ncbi:hypothetical protein J6590_074010 [Homalodisca vitripennis]|nr:hypothetical protein J6590_074010 [Homalodisca vitripennis]